MKRNLFLSASILILSSTICFSAASIRGLGDLPGGSYESMAYGVSADGSVVSGYSGSTNYYDVFRWTAAGGIQNLNTIPNSYSLGGRISCDGSAVVGDLRTWSGSVEAYRWTSSGGTGLGFLPQAIKSSAFGTSADGSVVVGVSYAVFVQAFRWTAETGMTGLGYLPGGSENSFARGVSGDGSVVVGDSSSSLGTQAFRWTSTDGMIGLGDFDGGTFQSSANAVSADGSVIVGYGRSSSGQQAFRWTSEEGMVSIGGGDAYAVSADGSVIVGSNGSGAFYWTQSGGMQNLKDLLISLGADLTTWNGKQWTLTAATGISADGKTIVGYGYNGGSSTQEAWVATIPEPCTLILVCVGGLILRKKK
jgi:probable HAF family extracellular repeat protein